MGLDALIEGVNVSQNAIKSVNGVLKKAEIIQPAYEMQSAAKLPKKLNTDLGTPTAEKMRQAIFALLTGQSESIISKTGQPIPTMQCNDAMQNENVYDKTFSLPKHISAKERVTEYETLGQASTITQRTDLITKLNKYDVTVTEQENIEPIPQPDGSVQAAELHTFKSQRVVPTNYSGDKQLQTLINSLVVTISNSVAEAVTKVIMSKIEDNQTDIEIEFNPAMFHDILLVNLNGPVVPGPSGSVMSTNGKIAFKGSNKYKHKMRISFGNQNLLP